MLGTLTILLLCQLAGELIARVTHLPVPGPVIGMLLLFAGLLARGGVPKPFQDTVGGILRHLSLLFIPAGVGVMVHMERLSAEALPIVIALFGSTLLGVAVTAKVMAALLRRPAESTDAEGSRP